MPFIRHSRDKRGYETTYVMHAYRPQPGPQRTRVLYFFRSPSHIKIGRRVLDNEIREALEHTHPDVSFDWNLLGRESAMLARPEPPPRERTARTRRPPPQAPASRPVAAAVPDDRSVLGRVLGAGEAARLRGRYAELLQRINRRSRAPEERDRLTAHAERLNPDEWSDESAIRAAVRTVEADWEAVVAELPARRRGRRGGRRRPDAERDEASSGLSVIIEESGGTDDAVPERVHAAGDGGDSSRAPDGAGVGAEPDAEPGRIPRDS